MKLLFNTTCKDKHTGTIYEAGKGYEFEDERANEILKSGLAEMVQEEQKEIDDLEAELDKGKMVNLNELTINELKKLAKELNISASGKKDEIIERILNETCDPDEVLEDKE